MASRPVFFPNITGPDLVQVRCFDFPWASGFSATQKMKNVKALHDAAQRNGVERLLEISTKSTEEVGRRLSAFSLKVATRCGVFSLESVYQGSKVFQGSGPFPSVFELEPWEAKRFIRNFNGGDLVAFELDGCTYPLLPQNAFYDWLYIRALANHADWILANVHFDAFTDIEFNPAKQVNCQARAFAEYLSLLRRNKLQVANESFETFVEMLKTGDVHESTKDIERVATLN